MATEGNIRDVLIAEMLGDVGLLHDKVESLKNILPGQVENVEQKIVGLIGLLNKAGDAYQEQIKKYTNAEVAKALALIEKESAQKRAQFDRDKIDAMQTTLSAVQRTVETTMQREVINPVYAALKSPFRTFWPVVFGSIICGMLSTAMVIGVNRYVIDSHERTYVAWGKALEASWDKVDAKTKAVITANQPR